MAEQIDRKDLDVRVDRYGYQLTYRGEQIGGASTERGRKIDPKLAVRQAREYYEMATAEIEKLVTGEGEARFYRAIDLIRERDKVERAPAAGQGDLFGGQQ